MRIGIIGYGTFGKLLHKLLKEKGLKAMVADKDQNLEKVLKAKVLILAVPISEFEKVVKNIAGRLKPGTLLVDVCSVKEYPARIMQKYIKEDVYLLATHPMWGVDSVKYNNGVNGLKIVLDPLRLPKKLFLKIKKKLEKAGFKIIVMSSCEHDKQASESQVLAQFTGKILEIMEARKVDISTKGYDHLLKLLPFVVNNTEQLFCDLQNYNNYSASLRKKFLHASFEIEKMIIKRNSENDFDYNRKIIDLIDNKIIKLFEERFIASDAIGKIKKKKGLVIEDKKREASIIKKRTKKTKLEKDFIENLYQVIFDESKKRQKDL